MIFLFRRINSHGSTDKSGDCSASSIRNQAATTEIRPAVRDRGLALISICTSWSSAVGNVISRSTEKPSSLSLANAETFGSRCRAFQRPPTRLPSSRRLDSPVGDLF